MTRVVRVATRGSRLALRQVAIVADLLGVEVEPVVVSTAGDRLADVPLRTIAGQGAFAADVRTALADGAADLAVHSAKDVPARDDQRFAVAYPPRADARDALVGATLSEIPIGGTVATGAPRRRAQIMALRPDLEVVELRGNIDTRLAKAGAFSAVVVAAAALQRLAIAPAEPVQLLPVDEFVPQVGQGALAVEARADDRAARRLLDAIDHLPTRTAVTAERSYLATLGGDCDLPAGAHATVDREGRIGVHAVLASADGALVRCHLSGSNAEALGCTVAVLLAVRLALGHTVGAEIAAP